MYKLNQAVCVKQWQVFLMLGLSGFAIGNVLAKITTALGF
jgi:hypothetical protein